MQVTQVYELMNTITQEHLGESVIVQEDLSNVIELGQAFEDAIGLDNYVKALNDQIGRMVFKDKVYKGRAPSVMMDGWEFGSIMQKVTMELPEAEANESWELEDGASYDPNIFTKPTVTATAWNKRVTFEIDMSFTEKQVKSSFQNATQLNAFVSMIYTNIANSLTVKLDGLIMRTINNLMGETVYDDYGANAVTDSSGIKAVNLLYRYNNEVNTGTALTVAQAIVNPEFIRFAVLVMSNYIDRLQVMSTLFNIGDKERFTSDDDLHVVMLSEFKNLADVYLQADTFNEKYTALPNAEKVAFWQGSGTDFSFTNASTINISTSEGNAINMSGILCTMFDRDALGVTNMDRRVKSHYNAKAEFFNEFHKYDAGYFNDANENMVVFFVA